jgi:beta-glucosidase
MDRFGFLDGGASHDVTPQAIEANAPIIERTGEEAAVLLKNEGELPLKLDQLNSSVLIGPTAGQVDAIGINGERSLGLPERQIAPLDAMKRISGDAQIGFAVADDMTGRPVPARLLSHKGQAGLFYEGPGGPRLDATIDFTTKGGNALPASITAYWTGSLTISKVGTYWLYLQALGTNASLYVDGKRLGVTGTFQGDVHGDILQANQDNVIPTTDGLDNVRRAIRLSKGRHTIRLEIGPDTSNAPVQLRLNWYPPDQRKADFDGAVLELFCFEITHIRHD